MKKALVSVVIPIYKVELSEREQASLQQVFRILGKHPICFIKPASLDLSPLLLPEWSCSIESFSDAFFKSTATYNELMLSTEFYDRFAHFEYILIYQTDAFVFRDELEAWCLKGYDYIGAPFRTEIQFNSLWQEKLWEIKKALARWFHLTEHLHGKHQPKEIILKRTVGNGGLSLRRVSALRKAVVDHPKLVQTYVQNHSPFFNEDTFFSIEMNRYWSRLSIPHWREAQAFAVEDRPSAQVTELGRLPFGCHAWDLYEPEFWLAHIRAAGFPHLK
ncbi:MAG: DUF5672 family protein [Spirosomataceae bacterium]